MAIQIGAKVRRKDQDLKEEGNRLSKETIQVLKACDFTGEVTQVQDGLIYVGFRTKDAWVTQVFKPDEIEEVAK